MDGILDYLRGLGISSNDVQLAAITTGSVVIITILIWCFKADPEAAVNFSVEQPEACDRDWKGELLKKPSIKV